MSIEAVGISPVNCRQSGKTNLKSSQSFTSNSEVDEEKSNATKYMVGATALAAVIGLGVLGYNGKLGKSVQKFLGGAEKAAEKGTKGANESAGSASKPLSEGTEKAAEKAGNSTSNVEPKIPEKTVEEQVSKGDNDAPKLTQGLEPISSKYSDGSYAYKIAPNGTKTEIKRVPVRDGEVIVATRVSKDGYVYHKQVRYDENKKVLETSESVNTPTFVTPALPSDPGYEKVEKEVFAKLREGLKWEE